MKKIVYYMPRVITTALDQESQNFLKLVSKNASAIDRTGSFNLPFDTHIIWNIPQQIDDGDSNKMFFEEMLNRARTLLQTNKPLVIFYSGGLDSTGLLVAFNHLVLTEGFSKEQITIATSIDAMYENLSCWWEIVLKYNTINVHDCLNNLDFTQSIYLMGENADQLFGSDKIFQLPRISQLLLLGELNDQNLLAYLSEIGIAPTDSFNESLQLLISKAPFRIEKMSELLWWINFSCKWQSVSLRTLCFTKTFNSGAEISHQQLQSFETFYNTEKFQQISMLKSFDRFNNEPAANSYKFALRTFIRKIHPAWDRYVNVKVKVGSLYNIVRHRHYDIQCMHWDDESLLYSAS